MIRSEGDNRHSNHLQKQEYSLGFLGARLAARLGHSYHRCVGYFAHSIVLSPLQCRNKGLRHDWVKGNSSEAGRIRQMMMALWVSYTGRVNLNCMAHAPPVLATGQPKSVRLVRLNGSFSAMAEFYLDQPHTTLKNPIICIPVANFQATLAGAKEGLCNRAC